MAHRVKATEDTQNPANGDVNGMMPKIGYPGQGTEKAPPKPGNVTPEDDNCAMPLHGEPMMLVELHKNSLGSECGRWHLMTNQAYHHENCRKHSQSCVPGGEWLMGVNELPPGNVLIGAGIVFNPPGIYKISFIVTEGY